MHCRAASTVIPLLPEATFTPSIQPSLGLPRTRPTLTSAINTLLAILYSKKIQKEKSLNSYINDRYHPNPRVTTPQMNAWYHPNPRVTTPQMNA